MLYEVITKDVAGQVHVYPDPDYGALRRAIAEALPADLAQVLGKGVHLEVVLPRDRAQHPS